MKDVDWKQCGLKKGKKKVDWKIVDWKNTDETNEVFKNVDEKMYTNENLDQKKMWIKIKLDKKSRLKKFKLKTM